MPGKKSRLKDVSKQIILWNQHSAGAYIACPLFANYAYKKNTGQWIDREEFLNTRRRLAVGARGACEA